MSFSELAENLGLEEDEYLELVKLLIETSRADLEGIETAIRDENSDEAINGLHSIKGAAGNMGLMEIYDLAKQGEASARNHDLDQLPDIVHGLKTKLDSLAEIAGI
jgi:HPt (histidine-containing phosphotransfer) domain-containing protein